LLSRPLSVSMASAILMCSATMILTG